MTKVTLISHSYVESACRRKFVYLSKGTDLRLITPSAYPMPYGWCPLDFEFNSGVSVQSYPIHFLHYKRTSTRWFLRTRDLGFSRFQPDLIHVENELHSWIGCQTLLYRRLFAPKAKVVFFIWDNLTLQEQGKKALLLEQVARINRRFVDFYICGNEAARQVLISKGVSPDATAVFPQYGIDADIFYPYSPDERESSRHEVGISPGEFAIGFVGRFVAEKGLLDLVEATGSLHTSSDRPVALVLTGKGDLEQAVRQRSAQLGIKLIILPARKYYEIAKIMNALDVLVLPSQSRPFWKEQYGKVLTEAMACATPVLGSDSGAIPEIIGDAGLVFHESDRENLLQCLRLCFENEGFRRSLGQKCLARVLAQFTNRRIANQTLEVYDRVTKLGRATSLVGQVV
jgi:glycosyltransferase involved in cell wall biosynthesis